MIRKALEDILVASGVVNTQQVEECQKEMEATGISLDRCLIEKNL